MSKSVKKRFKMIKL